MQDFKKLRVWQLAAEVALKVIEVLPPRASRKVPGLRSQAIRAATSVTANLAEGCSRQTRVELLRFVEIALGSHNELGAHLRLGLDAGVIAERDYTKLKGDLDLVRRMLLSLMRTLQRRAAEDENTRRETLQSVARPPSIDALVPPPPSTR